MASNFKIGYSGIPGAWVGVLRDEGGNVVAECGHRHPNRDMGSKYKTAARICMQSQVRMVIFGRVIEEQAEWESKRARSIELTGRDQYGERSVDPMTERAIALAPLIAGMTFDGSVLSSPSGHVAS